MRRWIPVLSSMVVLVLLAWATWWVVQTQRPPGAMTPIEAQAMDMSVMKPPKGAFPVGVETVAMRLFLPTVSYPATVRAYNEELVRARVTGKLVRTFVYPGDTVRAGQLLAQIEPEEYQERVREAESMRTRAEAEVSEAESLVHEAQAGLESARAQVAQAQAEVAEARQLLSASEAELRSVQAERTQKQAEIESATAHYRYWQAEAERLNALLAKGFVSKREVQQAETQREQARQQLESARAGLQATDARLEQLTAQREAMRARLQRAESGLAQAQSEAASTQARLQSANARLRRSQSERSALQANQKVAQLQQSYTQLVALNPGTITARLTEPGTLVEPGTPIFRLQNMQQVRVQARVAEMDAVRLKPGYPVWIKRYTEPKKVYTARIASIFREAESATRTVTVEARLPNPQRHWLPGEYAEMRLALQSAPRSALTVPVRAVQYDELQRPYVWVVAKAPQRHATTRYTCPMHPQIEQDSPGTCPICKMALVPKAQSGDYVARKRSVRLGATNGERIEIVDGLKPGEQVIVFGFASLVDGDPVFPTPWGANGPVQINPPHFTPQQGGHPH